MASASFVRSASARAGSGSMRLRRIIRDDDRDPFACHKPRLRRAAMTLTWSQPAWQCTSTLPSVETRSDRLAVLSSCAGHRAMYALPARRALSEPMMASKSISVRDVMMSSFGERRRRALKDRASRFTLASSISRDSDMDFAAATGCHPGRRFRFQAASLDVEVIGWLRRLRAQSSRAPRS